MKVLLSCVNSLISLIGFDLERREAFWYCPSDRLRVCGITYDEAAQALLVASDNTLTRIGPDCSGGPARAETLALPGPHPNLAHSVHLMENMGIGLADTGNSRLLVIGRDMKGVTAFSPLEGWPEIGPDAIHLNDFALTPHGIIASCFNYRPYRTVDLPGYLWQKGGYGLLLSLEKRQGRNTGRIVCPGLDCPHSLTWHADRLFCCSSATGDFIRLAPTPRGLFIEEERLPVTSDHFLRGVLPTPDGSWILGGSSIRRGDASTPMALYLMHPDSSIESFPVGPVGEIYDILPWNQTIMRPVADYLLTLPPTLAMEGHTYPPPCALE